MDTFFDRINRADKFFIRGLITEEMREDMKEDALVYFKGRVAGLLFTRYYKEIDDYVETSRLDGITEFMENDKYIDSIFRDYRYMLRTLTSLELINNEDILKYAKAFKKYIDNKVYKK